jgi:adenine-specific DNA-methyltransferase
MTVVNTPLLLSHSDRVEYMALIEDKISEIRDPALRASLLAEVKKLKSEKKFGLVFEEHIPELAAIYAVPIRPQATVARKTGNLNETYFVERVEGDTATVIKDASGAKETLPLADLVVIKRFGEPIYPALFPVAQVERGDDAPSHTIIEADNYHALQLLQYAYAGKVDVIYLDPPYNTGARDWKYNNRYVDSNDSWRHSRWLAMMKKRLLLATRLLREDGVLIITIDEYEVLHLGLLLSEIFPNTEQQLATIVSNPGGSFGSNLSNVNEFAYFVVPKGKDLVRGLPIRTSSNFFNQSQVDAEPILGRLRKRGDGSLRKDRKNMFYAVYVDKRTLEPKFVGEVIPFEAKPVFTEKDNCIPIYPIDEKGIERRWNYGRETMMDEVAKGNVVAKSDRKGIIKLYKKEEAKTLKRMNTVWTASEYAAGDYGSRVVNSIFGRPNVFPFPKSIYAVRDCIGSIVAERKQAIILDFFAGSGTALHSTLLLNAADGGKRQCILVTNNEVSEEEAKQLLAQGYQPNDLEWEARGICRSVTFPRCKYVINGQRDDGTPLEGEYLIGRSVINERPRTFRQLSFVDPASLSSAARKREITSLIGAIPQAMIEAETAFFVSEDERHTASILFDEYQAEAYLAALDGQEHISHFYIVTRSSRFFNQIKAQISDLLGPLQVQEEEKRPMREGFAANLEYFKLEFLDPNEVALGEQFAAILPVLWLRAGAKGPRPCAAGSEPYLIPADCPFAVLLEESYFKEFQAAIAPRPDLTHIFLVTDSEAAFFEMKTELDAPQVIMLYKDYLENFKINVQRV